MNKRSKYRFFLAADKGGSSGGGNATSQSSGGANQSAGGTNDDPWAVIDMDGMDDASRAAFETMRSQFATLQTTIEAKDAQVRQFQSAHDKTTAELARIKNSIVGDSGKPADPMAAYAAEVEKMMVDSGVQPTAAKAQAPIMAQLLKAQEEQIMKRVGAGVAPVTNMVMNHQAEQAYNYAKATDTTGAFAIPDVAQAIWNSCSEIAAGGTPITADTVKNLKAMHYMSHVETNGGSFATLQMNGGVPPTPPPGGGGRPPSVNISTGGYNYPGSTFAPHNQAPADPNAARTTLDPGTKAALQSIFSNMKAGHIIK